MPYAFLSTEQVDGERVRGARYEPNGAYSAKTGELVFSDVEFETNQFRVWDATNQSLRIPTTQDNLRVTKGFKRRELLLAFKTDYAAVWLIDGIEVEEQKDSILAKTAANRTANETNLVNQAGTLITKIKSKFADVNAATTEAQVQAITW